MSRDIYLVQIGDPLEIRPDALQSGRVGEPWFALFTLVGYIGAPTLTVAGDLPPGYDWIDHGDGTATLSIASLSEGGVFGIVVTGRDGVRGRSVRKAYQISVIDPVVESDPGDDPYIDYVVALLHFEGTHLSPQVEDEVYYQSVWWPDGDGGTYISTTDPLVGQSSLHVEDWGGAAVLVNVDGRFHITAGEFCIECWCRPPSVGTGFCVLFDFPGSMRIQAYTIFGEVWVEVDAVPLMTLTSVYPENEPVHFALTREWDAGTSSEIWRLYLNGVQVASDTRFRGTGVPFEVGGTDMFDHTVRIGDYDDWGTQWSWNGQIDEFRVTVGHARYPGGQTFTPVLEPFPDSPEWPRNPPE